MVKVLYWDMDGFVIWYKRLEEGRFRVPFIRGVGGVIDRRELGMLLEGVVPKKMEKRYILCK